MTDWSKFLRLTVGAFVVLALATLTLIVWANPHRNMPFISNDRPLMDGNQRFMYPSIARDLTYDSGVFGNSSVRFLPPALLNEEFGGHFAVLGMDAATPYEQTRLARLFQEMRSDAPPRTIIHGIGNQWCNRETSYSKFTHRPFPDWMYEHNPWNDVLYIFNSRTLEVSGRVLLHALGLRDRTHFEPNGFGDVLPDKSTYDVTRVRKLIYGQETPKPVEPTEPPAWVTQEEMSSWAYATHDLMRELIGYSPAETRVILLFVPYHEYVLPHPGSEAALAHAECKRRITQIAAKRPNTMLLDFMRPSRITADEKNFWDPVHYGHDTAADIVQVISAAVKGNIDEEAVTLLHDTLSR